MKIFRLLFLSIVFFTMNFVYAQTSFNISNKTTGDTLLTIDNNGYVGIGTTDPIVNLDVRGSNTDEGGVFRLGNSDITHQLLFFGGRENDPNPFILWTEGDPLRFVTNEGGWSEKMRIAANGNVGIGLETPSTLLEVADTISSTFGGFKFPDGSVQETAAGGGISGNTLDQAYDQGGTGAGRTITANAGAVTVAGIDGFLATGTYDSGTIPVEGEGTRMMWYPNKAAFRVGRVYGSGSTFWDNDSIGSYSFAAGRNTKGKAVFSVAMGDGATASGYASTSMGLGTDATGYYSTARGIGSEAIGFASVAMGRYTTAGGDYSTAMGRSTTASGDYSTAIGREIEASGEYSVAIALNDQSGTEVTQDNVMAIMGGNVGIGTTNPLSNLSVGGDGNADAVIFGETASSVIFSAGVRGYASNSGTVTNCGGYFEAAGNSGRGVNAVSTGSSGIGVFGSCFSGSGIYGGSFSGTGVYGFVNGTDGVAVKGVASHATGKGVVGDGQAYDFDAVGSGVNYGSTSSKRWKKNVIEIDNPLVKINQLRGVYFDWDEEHGGGHDIGCIAEEVGKVLPEIVVYEENGVDADGMDYSKLTPLLIEAVKSQQKLIEEQQKMLNEFKNRIEKLENKS